MRKTILFIVLVALSNLAFAANLYVRQGASGTASGADWTNAFTTLPATLNRGDTYYVADGSYGGYIFDDANSGTQVITIKKATVADHGTETGWSSTYGDGQAVFGGGIEIYTDYYTINGQVRNTNWRNGGVNQYGFSFGNVRFDRFDGAIGDFITFEYVDIHGSGRDTGNGDDVLYGDPMGVNITIRKCALRDSDRTIILSRGTPTNWLIEESYIARNTSTDAIHGEMWSFTDGADITFRYNVVVDIEGTAVFAGINDGTMTNLHVYGNVFWWTDNYHNNVGRQPSHNFGTTGIVNIHNDASNNNFGVGTRFFNNTIVRAPGTYSGVRVQAGSDTIVRNNYWYDTVRTAHTFSGTSSNNYYFNVQIAIDDATGTVCTVNCNKFTNYSSTIAESAADFTLASEFPTGFALSSPFNLDPNGITRGSSGAWDIGAFEFVTGGGDTTPPTVSSTVPTTGSTGVGVSDNVTATFSEALNPATVTTVTASIVRTSDSNPVASAVSYASNIITINPNADLSAGTQYTVNLTTGIQDVAGNALAATYSWTFTTAGSGGFVKPAGIVNAYDFEAACFLCDSDGSNALVSSPSYNPIALPGHIGTAAYFDGTKIFTVSLTTANFTSSFSFSGWFKRDSEVPLKNTVYIEETGTGIVGMLYGRFIYNFKQQNTVGRYKKFTGYNNTGLVSATGWNHLVFTYAAGVAKLYVNGVLTNTAAWVKPQESSFTSLQIGGSHTNNKFMGLIDQFYIFNTALSQTDVTALFNQTVN